MNQFRAWYSALPRAIRVLLTINVVFYLAWAIALGHIPVVEAFILYVFPLHPDLPGLLLRPWQLITYNFLHVSPGLSGLIHILFNMLLLYWIGRDHEEMHGSPQMLAIYLIAGVMGGLFVVFFHNVVPLGLFYVPSFVVGASAAVFGVMTMVATFYPDKRLGLLLLGPVKIVHIIVVLLLLDFILGRGQTAIAAHWGGVAAGYLFARMEQRGVDLSSWAAIFFPGTKHRGAAPPPRRSEGGFLTRATSWIQIGDPSTDEPAPPSKRGGGRKETPSADPLEEEEIDRILDKISEQGLDSLSERERKILEEASKR